MTSYAVARKVPPYERDRITPGKMYPVRPYGDDEGLFWFKDNRGVECVGAWIACAYLNGGDWVRIDEPDSEQKPRLAKWTPTTDLRELRRFGKSLEELCELGAVLARCIIPGIDEVDPGTGKANRQRLIEETADVLAQIGCNIAAFNLPEPTMEKRALEKADQMEIWEAMFKPENNT